MKANTKKYTFKVSLAAVDSLGIQLYSNVSAALTEIFANAWDADATKVIYEYDKENDTITIVDNGVGMTQPQVNERYLTVAYRKRNNEGGISPGGRQFMGRKGIGKLSVFAIAEEIELYTRSRGSEVEAFKITLSDLHEAIEKDEVYYPEEITDSVPEPLVESTGTVLVLKKLKSKRMDKTNNALRSNLARRFPHATAPDTNFEIIIDETPLTLQDRKEFEQLQFLWELGDSVINRAEICPTVNDEHYRLIANDSLIVDKEQQWSISGWVGSVDKPNALKVNNGESNLNGIMLIARGRPIQEDILKTVGFNGNFGAYVTGQIFADFLDLDDFDDIATSDRQRVVEDDERVIKLKEILTNLLWSMSTDWSTWRPKVKLEDTLSQIKALKDWVASIKPENQESAKKLIGAVATVADQFPSQQQQELYKTAIFGFERLELQQNSEGLRRLGEMATLQDLLGVLNGAAELERVLYGDILVSREQSVRQLTNYVKQHAVERQLQVHLYENLWLLDPAWEGATIDRSLEESLKNYAERNKDDSDFDWVQEKGRMDIRLTLANNKTVIVELKRHKRKVKLSELIRQCNKYYKSVAKTLDASGRRPDIEVVIVISGTSPKELHVETVGSNTREEQIEKALRDLNARILTYETIAQRAERQYREYAERIQHNSTYKTIKALEEEITKSQ